MTKHHPYRYIFGMTAAIITNLGLIAGLYFSSDAKTNIIGSILIIALADNISDSLSIHIYQESERFEAKEVWISTFSNFMVRLLVSLFFVLIVVFLPLMIASIILIVFGLLLLSFISYIVAKRRGMNPYVSIAEHLVIAILVVVVSRFLGEWITTQF
jgi:VIT1/CCC1 family predicted Fe2+/Mn2+ transporter